MIDPIKELSDWSCVAAMYAESMDRCRAAVHPFWL